MPEEQEEHFHPVHVLITEDFFLGKVGAAARALERNPMVPTWDEDVMEQVVCLPEAEMVLDLELEGLDVLSFLRQLRADARTQGMAVLGYSSHNLTELIEQAQGLGVQVVVRSSFAANLVRLMQDLFRTPGDPAQDSDE